MSGRIIVALSGGVDSAVTALLLVRAGHDVQGLFMHNWEEDDQGYCRAAEDFQDARQVAQELGIPLHRVDLSREYRERVFAHFLREYRAGRTPNPDVLCNREIKFGDCLEHALRLGGQCLATGHYARLEQTPQGPELHKGVDEGKDQSYFLHDVPRERFARALLPLGGLHKERVRELAREAGLPVHDKRDSTGICFIGERPFREFLSRYVNSAPGPILTPEGRQIGEHIGLAFYTLGQRSGIGIGGRREGDGEAWYVAAKDLARNALVVVQGAQHPLLFSSSVHVVACNWLCAAPGTPFDAAVRLRYRQQDQRAHIEPLEATRLCLHTLEPQRAVTPGQSAVLYQGTRCLGGGVIDRTDV
ncbi:MAG: tRNA 2-thiouridine(34) synthase MnmA [Steroidobacteraceae bacterium]